MQLARCFTNISQRNNAAATYAAHPKFTNRPAYIGAQRSGWNPPRGSYRLAELPIRPLSASQEDTNAILMLGYLEPFGNNRILALGLFSWQV